ncbi:hypothetical protein [Propionigenium maris]|nr:hypothetical protein [Propionigenium maris]
MKKILMGLILFVSLHTAQAIPTLYPQITEIEMKGDVEYEKIIIGNTGDQSVRYALKLIPFDEEYDLTPYVDFFPKVVEVRPGKQRVIKMSVKDLPKEFTDGEMRTTLMIEELRSKTSQVYKTMNVESEGTSATIGVNVDIGTTIYARKGNLIETVALNTIEEVEDGYLVTVSNTGNTSFQPKIELTEKDDTIHIETNKILRGGQDTFKVDSKYKGRLMVIKDSKGKEIIKENL